ncbi:ParB/RepB/Spo0J family partition protein [Fusibacter paucivorans]|uniref:ParB/RepB/Spo0J family partition protein n=1 Tax=Fusibacter paucivorans TaxID=76009 RepID=A0ABS5PN90_9FIRM|nr:ParB/RepB/Spo0J family partition protein [Fusibacter paucivorans]MBS7526533.1 ParB/RepB/Spo0J family partition protein [Fusibacter paucivorans]
MSKKTGLGRGLGALIPDDADLNIKQKINESGDLIDEIDIDLIIPNREQPRRQFDKEKIEALAESIRIHGLLQPIVLKRKDSFYEIIAGERRWRACKHIQMKKVPAIVKEVDEFTIAQLALIENIQREDLNPIEEAMAFQKLIDLYGMTQENLSKIVGRSRSFITNYLRMLKLEPEILKSIADGLISHGHGRALLGLDNVKDRMKAYDKIITDGLSVRQTEALVKNFDQVFKMPVKRKSPRKLQEIIHLEEQLAVHIGTKINIKEKNGKGKIEIDFYNIDDLNRIIDTIKK